MNKNEVFETIKENLQLNNVLIADDKIEEQVEKFFTEVEDYEIEEENVEQHLQYFTTNLIDTLSEQIEQEKSFEDSL